MFLIFNISLSINEEASTRTVLVDDNIVAIQHPPLIPGEFYHLVKRGVEERKIFLDDEDRLRFINSLLVFNDVEPTPWDNRAFWQQRGQSSLQNYRPKKPLVEILVFALMGNHFHILVRQLTEKGTTDFMRKLGGYSYYFNKKYDRVGPLFQGRFKAVRIKTESQLRNTFVYIHVNPIEIIEPGWKEKGIKNPQKTLQFLEKYRWSSYPDYIGGKNFPTVIKKEFFLKILDGEKGCKKEVENWVLYKAGIEDMKDIILE